MVLFGVSTLGMEVGSMKIKEIVGWLVAIAVCLNLFSCIFQGQSFMPNEFPTAPRSG